MWPALRLLVQLIASVALIAVATDVRASAWVDPAHVFRTLRTAHFSIHFHQGEERSAARLAGIAEDVWRDLERPLGTLPPRHTHVVLADLSELANGFATPLPYNTIFVTATWPSGAEFIGKTDDWLRLAFTHEFTHVVHLDRSEGWAKYVRGVFGRTALAFPNLYLPRWQIEGLATYEESRLTGAGRLHAGDFRAVVTEAARADRFQPLGHVNGGLTDWPGELGAYAYGVGFHEYLAQRFGSDSFARLASATAGRVPFTASRVFQAVYGESLGALWLAYQRSVEAQAIVRGPVATAPAAPTRLTTHGFSVTGPRYDRTTCAGCAPTIVYSARSPEGFPGLYEIGRNGSPPRQIAERYFGSTSAVARDTVYFDQQELRRNSGLYGDLYGLNRATGRVTQLTADARLLDPDLSPDGTTLACVQAAPGRRDLVLVSVAPGFNRTVVLSEPDTQFNAPRWSPDGRTIAVERHALGRESEVVIVDPVSREVRVVASEKGVRFVTPAWRADGRALVLAADFDEEPFNLYEVDVSAPTVIRRLTATTGGATWPDVSPDGATVVFVGYTADGFDLFEMPYPREALATRTLGDRAEVRMAEPNQPIAAPYDPLPTLIPTSWSPIIESDRNQIRIGAASAASDVLAYHGYAAAVSWLASRPADAPAPRAAVPDWRAYYQYARWRPIFWMSASANTSFFAGPAGDGGLPLTAALREREIEGGMSLPFRHVRVSQLALTTLVRGSNEFTLPDSVATVKRAAWRMGWALNSSRRYGYSVSPEDGVQLGATSELVREALGSSADATAATFDFRAYMSPFVRHHVLALRVGGGWSSGDEVVRRSFHLGGPQPNTETLSFNRQAFSLLRGFESDTFAGSRVVLMNAEYRWPIARPQAGHGTWPLFVHTLHAGVFGDVGHAWTRQFSRRNLKTSAGGEISFDLIAAYAFRLTVALGVGRGHDGSGTVPDRSLAYVRVGRSF